MGADLSYHDCFNKIYILSYYGQMPLACNAFGNPIFYRRVSEVFQTTKNLENRKKAFVK
jgi:hypothetical protein